MFSLLTTQRQFWHLMMSILALALGFIAIVCFLILGLSGTGSIYRYLNSTEPENIRPSMATLTSSLSPSDRVYVYYGAQPAFRHFYQGDPRQIVWGAVSRHRPDKDLEQINQLLAQPGRVWIVVSHCYYAECDRIIEHAARSHRVTQVIAQTDVALYGVDESRAE